MGLYIYGALFAFAFAEGGRFILEKIFWLPAAADGMLEMGPKVYV